MCIASKDAYLGAAEVDDLDVAFGVLVREADPKQDAQGSAERVARHEDLGVRLELEHLVDLRVVVGEKGRCWLHGWVKASGQGSVRVRVRVGLTKGWSTKS